MNKYHYTGPIYINDRKIEDSSNLFTAASSYSEARRNFLHRLSRGRKGYNILVADDEEDLPRVDDSAPERAKCNRCGYELDEIV